MSQHGKKLNTLYIHEPAVGVAGQESYLVVSIDTENTRALHLYGVDFFAAFDTFADVGDMLYQSLIIYRNIKIDTGSPVTIANQISTSQTAERIWGIYTRDTDGGRDFARPMRLPASGIYAFVHRYKLGGPTDGASYQGLTVRGELVLEPPGGIAKL